MDVLAGRILLAQQKEKEQELKTFRVVSTYDPTEISTHEETPVAALLESLITDEVASLQEEALAKTAVEDEQLLEILEDPTVFAQMPETVEEPEVVAEVKKTNKKRKAEIK